MDAAQSSKPFVHIYQSTECRIPESCNLESLVLSCSAAEGDVFRDGAMSRWVHIQGVTGGTDQTSGGCSSC